MTRVSPSEHTLLTLARAVVGHGQYGPVEDLLRGSHSAPERLSPGALHVLRDTLAKGTVLSLIRRGGWRRQRHLHGAQERSGRLWQRHPLLPLHFSALCVQTLQWLAEQPLDSAECKPLAVEGAPTLADELFLYSCCHLVAGTPCGPSVGAQPVFRRSALCWLGFPELLGQPPAEFGPALFTPLLASHAPILEALQADLARRWLRLEESKHRISNPADMIALGQTQEAVLTAFLSAIDSAGRRDLAGFLIGAGKSLMQQPASWWVAGLSPQSSLRERSEAAQAAGAFLRGLERLGRWDAEHRMVRFFDDGYEVAQVLLSEWKAFGEAGFRRAADLLRGPAR
jgi:hypothetical protein